MLQSFSSTQNTELCSFQAIWDIFPPFVHPDQTFYTARGLFCGFFPKQHCQVLKCRNYFTIDVSKSKGAQHLRSLCCWFLFNEVWSVNLWNIRSAMTPTRPSCGSSVTRFTNALEFTNPKCTNAVVEDPGPRKTRRPNSFTAKSTPRMKRPMRQRRFVGKSQWWLADSSPEVNTLIAIWLLLRSLLHPLLESVSSFQPVKIRVWEFSLAS